MWSSMNLIFSTRAICEVTRLSCLSLRNQRTINKWWSVAQVECRSWPCGSRRVRLVSRSRLHVAHWPENYRICPVRTIVIYLCFCRARFLLNTDSAAYHWFHADSEINFWICGKEILQIFQKVIVKRQHGHDLRELCAKSRIVKIRLGIIYKMLLIKIVLL